MKKRPITKILFTILICMMGANASAYDIAVENVDDVTIYYNYINDGKELEVTFKAWYQYEGHVVIPDEVTYMNKTLKVTSIGGSAFSQCNGLTSVTIPNSVISIGGDAFWGCSGLTSVIIPSSVTSIGNSAFQDCSGLTSVNIPNSITSIGNHAFRNCSGLTSVIIPSSVTSIGQSTFQDCSGLTSVTIPNSITSIGECAFYRCSGLTSVNIPNSVTSIGNYAFYECWRLTSVTIPNSVTYIGNVAFYACRRLTSVTIPNSVTYIGDGAFEGVDMSTVISLIENPFKIGGKTSGYQTFNTNTFNNAILYVPVGAIDKYKATEGCLNIEEGITNIVANVHTLPLLIQTNGSAMTVSGADDGTPVSVYSINGTEAGSAISQNGEVTIPTTLQSGSAAIVKVGNKSVKVVVK